MFSRNKALAHGRLTRNGGLGRLAGVCVLLAAVLAFAAIGCAPRPKPPVTAQNALERLKESRHPFFEDDEGADSLRKAMESARRYLQRLDPQKQFTFGPDAYPAARLLETLDAMERLINTPMSRKEFDRAISEQFIVYRSVGATGRGAMLFTGYYEPLLSGSLDYDPQYPHALYSPPEDLLCVNLGLFNSKFQGEQICGRFTGDALVPFYSREEIEKQGKLRGQGLEIAWVKDPIDLFFLHVQGSGRIVDDKGHSYHVHYAGKNGQPYRSIGKLLIDEEKISREAMSMQQLRRYLEQHPGDMDRILNHNPSYVFFNVVDQPALGYAEQPLEGGRSAAIDHRLFPMGALAFVKSEKPVAYNGVLTHWEDMNRFVVSLDTGGAIRGPGRLDLFWGNGPYAELAAGNMKQDGVLYFLVVKK